MCVCSRYSSNTISLGDNSFVTVLKFQGIRYNDGEGLTS